MRQTHSTSSAQQRGVDAEARACRYLEAQGMKLLQRNFRCRRGEIDLIMQEGKVLVFVEVRMRSNPNFGSGADSITARKQARLTASAQYYLQLNAHLNKHPARFDVISINGATQEVDWIQNAIQGE